MGGGGFLRAKLVVGGILHKNQVGVRGFFIRAKLVVWGFFIKIRGGGILHKRKVGGR